MEDLNAATFGGYGEEPVQVDTRPVITHRLVYVDLEDERVQDVLARIKRAISAAYPEAEYASYIGTNPLGVYLDVYTPGDDFDGVLKTLDDKLGDLNVAAGVNICVAPQRKAQVQAA